MKKYIGKKVVIYEKDYVGYVKENDRTEGTVTAVGDEFLELNGTGLLAIKYIYAIFLTK